MGWSGRFSPFDIRLLLPHNPRQISESCLQYFFSTDGQNQQGPVERDGLLTAGLTRDSMVWREGMGDWVRAGDLAELSDLFQSPGSIETPIPAEPIAVVPQQPTPLPYGQGGYQPGYATPQYGDQVTSGYAIASLVLGIVGLLICCTFIPSILAVVFGHLAKSEIRRTGKGGDGMATAGLIMGYLSLILAVVSVLFRLLAVGASLATHRNF